MPDNIGNQLQNIAQEALSGDLLQENSLGYQGEQFTKIKEGVKRIRNIFNIPWAFRLGRDVYPKFIVENQSDEKNDFSTELTLKETEWCMKRLMHVQLALKKAFSDLHAHNHGKVSSGYFNLHEYDKLFKDITQKYQVIFNKLKERRNRLLKQTNESKNIHEGREITNENNQEDEALASTPKSKRTNRNLLSTEEEKSSFSQQGNIFVIPEGSLNFLLGAFDAATGQPPSLFTVWYAEPSYWQGRLAESTVEIVSHGVMKVGEAVGSVVGEVAQMASNGVQNIARGSEDCFGECGCNEGCGKCCGGGSCAVCGGGVKTVATGAGAATISSNYADPASTAQATTAHSVAHSAGLFSHAAWSHFFAFTTGTIVTLLNAAITAPPVLYNFAHSLVGKLIRGGEGKATASRDRRSAAKDLFFSISLGALFFFSFLALSGPHAAITALILGVFLGDRFSKSRRKNKEREDMGGIRKPSKWVPTKETIESLEAEELVHENQPGAGLELKQNMILQLLEQKASGENQMQTDSILGSKEDEVKSSLAPEKIAAAEQAEAERTRLEAISQVFSGCYRAAKNEKDTSDPNCYLSLFSHYKKSENRKKAVGFVRALNGETELKSTKPANTIMTEANTFIEKYKENRPWF